MTKRSVVICVALLAFWTSPSTGQNSLGERTSLVINEIMPIPHDPDSPWFELLNFQGDSIRLVGLILQTAFDEPFEIPPFGDPSDPQPQLRPGEFLVVVLDSGTDEGRWNQTQTGEFVLHAPVWLAASWTPRSGEISVLKPVPGTDPVVTNAIDYVAWGDRGGHWSKKHRKALWPGPAFVSLVEGFGVVAADSSIGEGSTIGRYPGGSTSAPEDWVLFDPDETTPGEENSVPRPKAFNIANGSTVGARSFGVSWPGRKGDDWYRVQIAEDSRFDRIIVDEITIAPRFRLGGVLTLEKIYFRVTAFATGVQSLLSGIGWFLVVDGDCDWPVITLSPSRQDLENWIANPGCRGLPSCKIIPSMDFKFQRKDTPLICKQCMCRGECDPGCSWKAPQPHCTTVAVSESHPTFVLCAGGDVSPLCGSWWGARGPFPFSEASVLEALPIEMTLSSLGGGVGNVLAEKRCDHGSQNCVRASVSMIVSAYGNSCLSQDHIAFENYQHSVLTTLPPEDPINETFDLGHGYPMSCGGGSGGECSDVLKRALNISPSQALDPDIFVFRSVPPSFSEITSWIDSDRPIMTQSRIPDPNDPGDREHDNTHMRVLAGYCLGEDLPGEPSEPDWVYIYDPDTGPRAETYDSWKASADLTWVAPPAQKWPLYSVKNDSVLIWNDFTGDGCMDFDNALRLPPSQECPP